MGTRGKQYKKLGKTQQKILLILAAGVALGLTHSPRTQWRIIRALPHAWREIERPDLRTASHTLYRNGMTRIYQSPDGDSHMVLTRLGMAHARRLQAQNISIRSPHQWDGKWSAVAYDIPESKRQIRLDLSQALKYAGFFKMQQSLFVHPYPCESEVRKIVELCNAGDFVHFMRVDYLANDTAARDHFAMTGIRLS